MIKSALTRKIATLALTTLCGLLPFSPTQAGGIFEEQEVQQSNFITVAQPFGENKYNLIVIEQIPNKKTCWSEKGANPVNVDLLLLDFDFSGHCRRSTDANGYSIRYDGEDMGLDVLLTLAVKDGNLLLMGINRKDPRQEAIVVGTAEGLNSQPMKIQLNPGWHLTKRTYQGKALGHVYFSYNSAQGGTPTPKTETTTTPPINDTEMIKQGTMREIVAPPANP
jgi:hypothetical protein